MKLMFIQELQVLLGNLEDLAAQPTNHCVRGQQVIALDAISLGSELDSDHDNPPPKSMYEVAVRQAGNPPGPSLPNSTVIHRACLVLSAIGLPSLSGLVASTGAAGAVRLMPFTPPSSETAPGYRANPCHRNRCLMIVFNARETARPSFLGPLIPFLRAVRATAAHRRIAQHGRVRCARVGPPLGHSLIRPSLKISAHFVGRPALPG
jgi:hypothetical protein